MQISLPTDVRAGLKQYLRDLEGEALQVRQLLGETPATKAAPPKPKRRQQGVGALHVRMYPKVENVLPEPGEEFTPRDIWHDALGVRTKSEQWAVNTVLRRMIRNGVVKRLERGRYRVR